MNRVQEAAKRRGGDKSPLRVPRVLRNIGEEAARNGTDRLSSVGIDEIIRSARSPERASQAIAEDLRG